MVFRRSKESPSGSQEHWRGPRDPPRRLSSRATVLLSQAEMFFGLVVTTFSVILLLIRDRGDGGGAVTTNGYIHLAAGLVILLTGMVGVCILNSRSTCSVSTYLFFCILSAIYCVAGFIIWLLELIDLKPLRIEFKDNHNEELIIFMAHLFAIVFVICFIIFIISISYCINSLRSPKDYSSGQTNTVVPAPYDTGAKMATVVEAAYIADKQSRDGVTPVASISRQSTLPRDRGVSNTGMYNSQSSTLDRSGTLGRDNTMDRYGSGAAVHSNGEGLQSNHSTLAREQPGYASVNRSTIGKKDCTLIFLD